MFLFRKAHSCACWMSQEMLHLLKCFCLSLVVLRGQEKDSLSHPCRISCSEVQIIQHSDCRALGFLQPPRNSLGLLALGGSKKNFEIREVKALWKLCEQDVLDVFLYKWFIQLKPIIQIINLNDPCFPNNNFNCFEKKNRDDALSFIY